MTIVANGIAARSPVLLLFLLTQGFTTTVGAQDSDRELLLHAVAESLDPDADQTLEDEDLALLLDNPLNLNRATSDQLQRVPGLTRSIAERIVVHRNVHGSFTSVDSLTAVRGISESEAARYRVFLFVAPNGRAKRNTSVHFVQKVGRRLDLGRGYRASGTSSRYVGGPINATSRLTVEFSDRLAVKITADQDAGEPFVWRPSRARFGPDLITWSLSYHPEGIIRTLIVGDVQYGSRLGLAMGRTSFASFEYPLGRVFSGLPRTSSSTTSAGRLRGIAVHAASRFLELTLIASQRLRDATSDTTAMTPNVFELVNESGLHRTETELNRRSAIRERVLAGRIGVRVGALAIGVHGHVLQFGHDAFAGSRPDAGRSFRGRSQRTTTLDASFDRDGGRCTAEASIPWSASFSMVALCSLRLTKSDQVWFYARTLSNSRTSWLASTLDRNSGAASNERGVTIGWRSRPFRKALIAAHADVWWAPWIRYRVWVPSSGREVAVRISVDRRRYEVSLRAAASVRDEGQARIDRWNREIRGTEAVRRTRFSLRVDLHPTDALRIRTASSISIARTGTTNTEWGSTLSIGMRFRPRQWLDFASGVSTFDARSDAVRLYDYEPSTRYGFGSIRFSGVGERWYILTTLKPVEQITFQIKFSSMSRYGERSVGSGLEEVEGNRIRQIEALFEVKI